MAGNEPGIECLTDVGKRCYENGIIGTQVKQDGQFQAGDWAVLGVVLGISAMVGLYERANIN